MWNPRPVLLALLVVAAFTLDGCHKYSMSVPAIPSALSKGGGYPNQTYLADLKLFEDNLKGENDPETVKALRNRIASGLMAEIDKEYGEFTWRLYFGKADIGVAGDSAVLGLTAAATIATHTPTKTILSALGTAVTGVNLSVDKNFFAQQTYQTIAVAMQNRRDKARTLIVQNLQDDDVEDYPLEAVKRDLVAYFYAGTLPGGLQELQEEAAAAAQKQAQNPVGAIH